MTDLTASRPSMLGPTAPRPWSICRTTDGGRTLLSTFPVKAGHYVTAPCKDSERLRSMDRCHT